MLRRVIAGSLVAFTLVACDRASPPAGWGKLDRPTFGGCPNIAGDYRLAAPEGRHLSHTFVKKHYDPGQRSYPYQTMTIAGDAARELQLTFAHTEDALEAFIRKERIVRPRQRESDDQLKRRFLAATHSVTLRRGQDYECAHGWIRTDRVTQDTPADRGDPLPPPETNGESLVARDHEGFLVAHFVYKQNQRLDLWCGDGCRGIPLGRWTVREWSRWPPAQPR